MIWVIESYDSEREQWHPITWNCYDTRREARIVLARLRMGRKGRIRAYTQA
jgi:hypothetical protein